MKNSEIDFKAVFGDGFYQPSPSDVPGSDEAPVPCPGQPACPPVTEVGIVTEPLEPVCTCTPEDHAYRQGAEDMRKAILMEFEHLWDRDECTCYRCLKAVIADAVC